jgi:hypothetical protein
VNEISERRDLATVIRINSGRAARREIADLSKGLVSWYAVSIGGPMGLDPTTAVCLFCVGWLQAGTKARIWYSRQDGKMRLAHRTCLDEALGS